MIKTIRWLASSFRVIRKTSLDELRLIVYNNDFTSYVTKTSIKKLVLISAELKNGMVVWIEELFSLRTFFTLS